MSATVVEQTKEVEAPEFSKTTNDLGVIEKSTEPASCEFLRRTGEVEDQREERSISKSPSQNFEDSIQFLEDAIKNNVDIEKLKDVAALMGVDISKMAQVNKKIRKGASCKH